MPRKGLDYWPYLMSNSPTDTTLRCVYQGGPAMRRRPVNKAKSARHFRYQSSKTKLRNLAPPPARGGIRL